jgi:CBS domain-containing protein
MTVRSVVDAQKSTKQPFCEPAATVLDAAVKIAELDVNALAVVQDGTLAGIITDHDIIRALADSGANLSAAKVRDWMTSKVVTCSLDDKLSKALNLMAGHKIRHLVVVEDDRPVAVLGSKELLTRIHENDDLELRVLRDLARVTQASQVA